MFKVIVTANLLNGRLGPGVNYPVVAQVGKGGVLTLVHELPEWIAAATGDGGVIWFYKPYTRPAAASEEGSVGSLRLLPLQVTQAVEVISRPYLNGRVAPGTNHPVIDKAETGAILGVVYESGEWVAALSPEGDGVVWYYKPYTQPVTPQGEPEFAILAFPTPYPYYPGSTRRALNQGFGANPQNYKKFGLPGHEGLDFFAKLGDPVFAVAPGVIYRVHAAATGHNYGRHLGIAHKNGYRSIYAHFDRFPDGIAVGSEIDAGQVIGFAGNTGNSFGVHLHFTLKKDGFRGSYPYNIIDPTPFFETFWASRQT